MQYHKNAVLQLEIARHLVEISGNFTNFKEKTIADIGCGSGFIAENLIETGITQDKILQLDQNPHKLSFANQFGKTEIWNFNQPFAGNEKFDIIFSSMALQWAFNFEKTVSYIHKMLAPKGKLFLAVPVNSSLAEIYQILGKNFMVFPKQEAINATLIETKIYKQNSFDALKSMHTLNLKVEKNYKITKEMVQELNNTTTNWQIGFFMTDNRC